MMHVLRARTVHVLPTLALFTILNIALANLMAVDLGEAYIKVSVAKPGKGLELVTNEQSKRKTPAVVGFTAEGERLFGDAAVAYAAKAPGRVIFNARRLIGACADGETTPIPFCKPATVTVDGVGSFTGVHAVAMLLAMARRQASAALGGAAVHDVAVTVPAWFNHAQRVAICDSAAVAGLNCLGVVNSNVAAAVKYALDGKAVSPSVAPAEKKRSGRKTRDADAHTVLFYDVGASSASATVARFFSHSAKGPVSRIQVLAHASDTSIGGTALDELLVEQMADDFDKQREGTKEAQEDPRKARELPRVMTRLRKEARRAREILSVNTERLVTVTSLHQDMDFKTTVTRAALEKTSSGVLSAVPRPALQALSVAKLVPEQLSAVVPFGGTIRMPKIQSLVLEALGKSNMNKSINGDEAAVMGAAFFGASLSSTFRVRKLDIQDKFPRTVSAEIQRDLEAAGRFSSVKQKRKAPQNVIVFDASNAYMPSKKTVSFSRADDFEVKLYFDLDKTGMSDFPERTLYSHMKIKGVAKVLEKLGKNPGTKKGAPTPTPRVALTFKLDRSGNVIVGTAESSVDETITVEREVPVKEPKSKSSPAVSPAAEQSPAASAENETDAKSDKSDEAKNETKEEKKKTKIEIREQSIVHRQTLTVEYVDPPGSIRSLQMTGAELEVAKKVLKALEDADNTRAERADALNALEGYILGARSKLRGAEEGDAIYEVSTETERDSILAALDEAEDWMFTDAAEQTASLRSKHHELRKLLTGIEIRVEEREARPKAVQLLRTELAEAMKKIAVVEKLHAERKSGHADKFGTFAVLADKTTKWLDEQVAAQEKRPATDDPVLTLKAIEAKYDEIGEEIKKLAKLELPPAPSVAPVNNTEAKGDKKVEIDAPDAGAAKTDPNIGAKVDAPAKDEL